MENSSFPAKCGNPIFHGYQAKYLHFASVKGKNYP